MTNERLLEVEKLSKGFGVADGQGLTVLKELSLSLDAGGSLAILGPSGSGKTTLLNLIGGLDFPDAGAIRFRGTDISSWRGSSLDAYRNKEIGFVFQFHHLLPQCTLMENILVPTLVNRDRGERSARAERAEALMKRVGIWEHRHRVPGKVSGGECQRAAVVRAMINGPSLLLADEPTGALDSGNVDLMADLLLELNRSEGMGLLMVTHSARLAEKMDHKLVLREGRLTEE